MLVVSHLPAAFTFDALSVACMFSSILMLLVLLACPVLSCYSDRILLDAVICLIIHNNGGYSWSRYELGNKLVIMS